MYLKHSIAVLSEARTWNKLMAGQQQNMGFSSAICTVLWSVVCTVQVKQVSPNKEQAST
jgi:hypothetical protein